MRLCYRPVQVNAGKGFQPTVCLNRINIYRWKDGHEGLMSFSSLLLPTSSPSGKILFSFSIQEVVHLVSLIQSLFGSWMASKDCTWNNCLNAPSLLCDVREVELFTSAYLKSFRQPWPPCRCPLARIHSHILKKNTHTWGSLHETLDPVWTCSVSLQQSAALLSLSPFCLQRKGKHTSVSDNVTVWSHLHETSAGARMHRGETSMCCLSALVVGAQNRWVTELTGGSWAYICNCHVTAAVYLRSTAMTRRLEILYRCEQAPDRRSAQNTTVS